MPTSIFIIPSIAILIGFVALLWSADRFITGAASIAFQSGMSKMLIGLTIVAFGTSAPEIMVSFFAALDNSSNMAVGNAIGSNLANIGLVLGITALIAAIPATSKMVKTEMPILVIVTLIAGYTLHDQTISFLDSILLFSGLLAFTVYLFKQQQSNDTLLKEEEEDVEHFTGLSTNQAWIHFTTGLIILLLSANLLVWGAKEIAIALEVPELIIGLTIVAIGTSLPELAASVTSALRGHHEIAFGNIIGSNIFNLLIVMAIPGFVGGANLDANIFTRDYLAMFSITMLWVILMWIAVIRKKAFSRLSGGLLLLTYSAYYVVLYQQL